MDSSVDVAVANTMPDRQLLEGLRQLDDDEDSEQEKVVNVFNLEAVADTIFHLKKKSVGEFDGDADDEGDNPLAVLEVELDEDEVNSENMEDWLKKLHIRTQHLVGKVTLNGMSRLAATNNVATALTRFKGKVRVDTKRAAPEGNSNGDNNSAEEEGQSTLVPEMPTTPTEIASKDDPTEVLENPCKESAAVRSKKETKPSSINKTEPNKTPRRKVTSPISSGTKASASSSEIRKTGSSRTAHPAANGLPAPASRTVVAKTNKVKTVKKVRSSGMKSKVH